MTPDTQHLFLGEPFSFSVSGTPFFTVCGRVVDVGFYVLDGHELPAAVTCPQCQLRYGVMRANGISSLAPQADVLARIEAALMVRE